MNGDHARTRSKHRAAANVARLHSTLSGVWPDYGLCPDIGQNPDTPAGHWPLAAFSQRQLREISSQRQFFLRPDETTNNAFVYCLIDAALRCEIDVLLPCAMSNHYLCAAAHK